MPNNPLDAIGLPGPTQVGLTTTPQPRAADAQPQAGQVAPVDLSQATTDPNGAVWVSRGGRYYTVAADRAERALRRIEGLRLAAPEEVAAQREIETQRATPGAGVKAALENFGIGVADALTSPGRALGAVASVAAGAVGATDTELALQDFVRDAGGHALAKDLSYAGGGVEGENSYVRAYNARAAAFPMTTTLARTAGLVVPALATAGLAGAATGAEGALGESVAARLATTVLSPSGVTQTALGGAAQGLLAGVTTPFETMDDTPISREAILASGAMGAFIGLGGGAAVGAVAKYAPSALSRVFGERSQRIAQEEVHASMPEVLQGLRESDHAASQELYQSILDKGQIVGRDTHAMADRIESAMKNAGPNPQMQAAAAREAVESEVARLTRSSKEILPSEWRDSSLTPDQMVRNRDVLQEGARNEITERLSAVVDESRSVMEHLRSFELKRPLVAKNLAELSEEQQTAAISRALQFVRNERQAFEGLFGGEGGRTLENALRANRTTESLGFSLNEAEKAISSAPTAADAYVAVDRLRRETDKWIAPLTNQSRATSAAEAFEGKELLKFTEGSYENSRRFLADSETWGKQGLLQQQVNAAWADDIAAEGRVTKLGAFMSRDVSDRYGQFVQRVDPDKIDRYLEGLGKKTLPDQDLQAMLETKAKLMREVGAAYGIAPDRIANAVTQTQELSKAVKAANTLMTATGGLETQVANILQSRLAHLAGGAAGAVLGGHAGGVPGAIVGHSVGAAVEEFAAHRVPEAMAAVFKNKAGFGRLPQVYQRALNRNVVDSVPAFVRPIVHATSGATRAEREDTYKKRTEMLAQLTTSQAAQVNAAQSAFGRFGTVQQSLPGSTQLAATAALARLQQAWPGQTRVSAVPMRGRAQTTASDADIRRSEALWEATTAPLSVFDDFKNGDLNPEKARWAWIQYPELQKLFQASAIDTLQKMPENTTIPHSALAQLDSFLGFGGVLDPSQSSASLARTAALAAQQRAALEQTNPRPANTQNFQTRVNQMMGV